MPDGVPVPVTRMIRGPIGRGLGPRDGHGGPPHFILNDAGG
jgi:hypothetical protein